MKMIASKDNPTYKMLKRLATSSQERRRARQTLLDGVHLCQAYLDAGLAPRYCMVSESALSMAEVAAILDRLNGDLIIALDDTLFGALAQVENGVAIAMLIDTPELASVALTGSALLLDRIQDPGNLGSMLRSAAAAGLKQVMCSSGTVFAWSPKVLRAGMGAHFQLKIQESCDLRAIMASASMPVLATSSHGDRTLYEHDLRGDVIWLFGNEGQGVAHDLMAHARTVRIPQPGGMESLNVAAAAAICLFEQVRQRAAGPV